MNDEEAFEFYSDPANRIPAGPGRKRKGPRFTSLTSVRFDPQVIESVKSIAFAEGITVGAWIRRAVEREREREARQRPAGLIPGSGRKGEPRSLSSSPATVSSHGRTFACQHMSIGNVASASCGICGPLQAVA